MIENDIDCEKSNNNDCRHTFIVILVWAYLSGATVFFKRKFYIQSQLNSPDLYVR